MKGNVKNNGDDYVVVDRIGEIKRFEFRPKPGAECPCPVIRSAHAYARMIRVQVGLCEPVAVVPCAPGELVRVAPSSMEKES